MAAAPTRVTDASAGWSPGLPNVDQDRPLGGRAAHSHSYLNAMLLRQMSDAKRPPRWTQMKAPRRDGLFKDGESTKVVHWWSPARADRIQQKVETFGGKELLGIHSMEWY